MSYEQAIRRLFAMRPRQIGEGVARMRAGLAYRGSPQQGMRFVHVAGTNGKGSVAAMIAASLRAAGHRTGLFTSPHLHRYVERVSIDGRALGEGEATRRIEELLDAFSRSGAPDMSFFELTTLLAVEAFRDHGCDIVVLEVGLGGRLDSTNALPSELTVITRIAHDHTRLLGDSLSSIAREKAGILRRGAPAVAGVTQPEAWRAISSRARRLAVPVLRVGRDFEASPGRRGRVTVRVADRTFADLRLAMHGDHQRSNAACAVAALCSLDGRVLAVPERAIRRGLERARAPGRMEQVGKRPRVILDAAHNPDGCEALARYLQRSARGGGPTVLVFSAMRDKPYRQMLAALSPQVSRIIYPPPLLPRAATQAQLARARAGTRARSVPDALARARRAAGPEGRVVVAGSIYLLSRARARLLGIRNDPLR